MLTKFYKTLWMEDLIFVFITFSLVKLFSSNGLIDVNNASISLLVAFLYSCANITIQLIFANYKRIWLYASIRDLLSLLYAQGFLHILLIIFTKFHLVNLSLLEFFALLVFEGLYYLITRLGPRMYSVLTLRNDGRIRTVIIGAGESTSILLKQKDIVNKYDVRYILDDDKEKHGKKLNNIEVLGSINENIKNLSSLGLKHVILSIPSMKTLEKKNLINSLLNEEIKVLSVPDLKTINQNNIFSIEEIDIEDLLQREAVKLDLKNLSNFMDSKQVLVTGAGGSIGSELVRQLVSTSSYSNLILIDNYENNLFTLQQELVRSCKNVNIKYLIASTQDFGRIDEIFKSNNIDIVYHAAAHKHVPLMQDSPEEAIKNNIYGTYNVAICASKYNVERFILISTDKAVNPTNIMGASKRVAEQLIEEINSKSKTTFAAVRFGNVLGSNGSVIPLFKDQIEHGGPVMVTHKDIIRYFMTIPEACSLVLQTTMLAKGGEIFVLDMGEPVKILDLAENMIRLSGHIPYEEIEVKFVGLRPGEKMYEELLINENVIRTDVDRIFIEEITSQSNVLYMIESKNTRKLMAYIVNEVIKNGSE